MKKIHKDRYELVKAFLKKCRGWTDESKTILDQADFIDQDDGGMGSFSIVYGSKRTAVRDIAEATYIDEDGIETIISLLVDDDGLPTDVDFWKVDSSVLKKFPDADKLSIVVK